MTRSVSYQKTDQKVLWMGRRRVVYVKDGAVFVRINKQYVPIPETEGGGFKDFIIKCFDGMCRKVPVEDVSAPKKLVETVNNVNNIDTVLSKLKETEKFILDSIMEKKALIENNQKVIASIDSEEAKKIKLKQNKMYIRLIAKNEAQLKLIQKKIGELQRISALPPLQHTAVQPSAAQRTVQRTARPSSAQPTARQSARPTTAQRTARQSARQAQTAFRVKIQTDILTDDEKLIITYDDLTEIVKILMKKGKTPDTLTREDFESAKEEYEQELDNLINKPQEGGKTSKKIKRKNK